MRKSSLILLGVGAAILFFFSAFQVALHGHLKKDEITQPPGPMVSELRAVSNFRKITVGKGLKVFFQQDSIVEIKIEAPENLLKYIKAEITNELLVIEKTKRTKRRDTITVFISNPKLNALEVAAGTRFETIGSVSGTNLILEFGDDSSANLELSYDVVKCKASSGSKVNISGNSKEIDFSN